MATIEDFHTKTVPTDYGNLCTWFSGRRLPDDAEFVLVHGLIVSSSFMKPTAKYLAQNHRVYVPDLMGHGISDTPERPLTIAEHAKTLASTLENLKIKKPIIVGGSYGCHVSVELANLMDVEALVFVGPTPGGSFREAFSELTIDASREPLQLVFNVISEIFRIGPARVIELLGDMARYPFHERLRAIKAPTLIITGEHDPFFDASFMDRTAEELECTHSLCMPNVAHGLPFTEPKIISDFIEQFVGRLREERSAAAA